jgi:formamidopyrimidine-DNA glycosylase
MNSHVVVGVGNIYASEALFRAGISPKRVAGKVSKSSYAKLVAEIVSVLNESIVAGGTTIKDFADTDGNPGYFKQQLQVYGRSGQGCVVCGNPIRQVKLGQRSTYYCVKCQK